MYYSLYLPLFFHSHPGNSPEVAVLVWGSFVCILLFEPDFDHFARSHTFFRKHILHSVSNTINHDKTIIPSNYYTIY